MDTYILNIETSGKACSVCIGNKGRIVGIKEVHPDGYVHAEQLNVLIMELLEENDMKLKDLSAIAVSAGPGSYTGLRIGVASAKGFCYALDLPLISLNSLEIMMEVYRQWFKTDNSIYIPMIDARRMEVYMSVFQNGKLISASEAKVIDESFMDDCSESVVLFGDGADKLSSISLSNQIRIQPDFKTSASGMVELSYRKFVLNDFEDVAYFDPIYLKEFQAG
ncbi:MAG: tRNA (adenosine(37)-N6)-threonylcarbamoyltransferase complex dimerization subunit type 1 TsaB [Flavobacteriales bacterium]|nr:tRNA (adenosine(37)-N6)-threonylcarbamoyltransferase complex dimerization subunit type 1 TsaB [Flavobacteriales bacterium]